MASGPLPTADQLAWAAYRLAEDRNRLLSLVTRVEAAVLDKTPDGLSVAYLPAELLAEIRDRLT